MTKIVEKGTGEVIGEVVTNRSLSFDEASALAGLEWKTCPEVETDGWYQGDVLVDESVAELVD